LFEGTGYNYVLVDNLSANTLNYQANQSKTERFLYGIDRFNAEYKIQGKQAYIHGLVGSDKDVILHEDLNIQDVSIEVDASGFHTWAKGFGDKDESKEDADYELEVEYPEKETPLTQKYGWIEGTAIRDGKYKKEKELKEAVKKQVENSVKISTTVTAIDLTNNGYPEMQFEEGDRVWLYVTDLKQNQQVRVVEIEETFDWEGNIIDAQYTLGNEGIAARYKSQQYNTLSDFRDIQNGKKTLEFNWLPEAIKRASDIINGNLDSHIEYHAGEIIGINKSNPNGYMRFNTDGLGFSRDGGKTYRTAITYEGIVADAITAGTLRGILIEGVEFRGGIIQSLNNSNTFWDLNSGLLEMENTEFKVDGDADMTDLSPDNRIYYERRDGSITRTSGLGVGNALNNQYPVVWMGTTGTSRSNFSPVDDRYVTGFIANTNRRTVEDGVGNSSIGELFDVRNLPVSYDYGFRFDLRGSKKVLRGLSAGNYDYELGESDSPFNALYLRNRMYADSDLEFRNRSNTSKGWRFETSESGNGDAITLRGLNTGSHNYQIGSDRISSRILNIYLRHNPDVSSDERLKTSFENVDIDFAKRFLEVSPKRYKYKLTNADLSGGIKGAILTNSDLQPKILKKYLKITTMIYVLNLLFLQVQTVLNQCNTNKFTHYITDYYRIYIREWRNWKMSSKKQLNHEHVINSLANKLVNAEVESSEKDAVIIALSQENEELKKDNENLREQLKENTRKKDNKKK